jgi:thioesterase domain-containing protein
MVAFEMARQLQQQDQPVALLALLDHEAPSPGKRGPAGEAEDDRQLLTAFLKDLQGRFAKELPALPDNLWQLAPEEQLTYLLEQAKMLEIVMPDGELLQLHRLFQVFKTHVRAMRRYRPQVYPGQIILFRASEPFVTRPTESTEIPDPTLGWSRFSTEPIKVHTVPGDHYTMLAEPQVQVLAGQLRLYLDQAQPVRKEVR